MHVYEQTVAIHRMWWPSCSIVDCPHAILWGLSILCSMNLMWWSVNNYFCDLYYTILYVIFYYYYYYYHHYYFLFCPLFIGNYHLYGQNGIRLRHIERAASSILICTHSVRIFFLIFWVPIPIFCFSIYFLFVCFIFVYLLAITYTLML